MLMAGMMVNGLFMFGRGEIDLYGDSYTMGLTIMNGFTKGYAYEITQMIIYLGYLPIFGIWYELAFARKKRATGKRGRTPDVGRLAALFLMGMALQLLISSMLEIFLPMFPTYEKKYTELITTVNSGSIFTIIAVVILAPIGEELLFRGVTMGYLRKSCGKWTAALVQGILFAMYHMNLVQGIYAFLIGVFFGVIAWEYETFLPGVIIHFSLNSSSYILHAFATGIAGNTPVMIGILIGSTIAVMILTTYIITEPKTGTQ